MLSCLDRSCRPIHRLIFWAEAAFTNKSAARIAPGNFTLGLRSSCASYRPAQSINLPTQTLRADGWSIKNNDQQLIRKNYHYVTRSGKVIAQGSSNWPYIAGLGASGRALRQIIYVLMRAERISRSLAISRREGWMFAPPMLISSAAPCSTCKYPVSAAFRPALQDND